MRWASLDDLKELYRQQAADPLVLEAQAAFAEALQGWSDLQVTDFLANELFEPPFSVEVLSKPMRDQREILSGVYAYLFGR